LKKNTGGLFSFRKLGFFDVRTYLGMCFFFIREYQVVAAVFLFLIAGTNIAVVAIMAR
jgi:hypothetical protein